MPRRHLHVPVQDATALRTALAALRTAPGVPGDFPPEVLAAADAAVRAPRMPEEDATGLALFTVDPPGSRDLDQAMHLARTAGGYRVHYAIADVAAFVTPGAALDDEAHRRAMTLYFPDGRVPLHPPVLGEGAASLLPGEVRPALLWRFDLDQDGDLLTADVRRARVRSRARLDYATVQRTVDDGTAEEPVALLRDIGVRRAALEAARGGISLSVPEQEITRSGGSYVLGYRAPLPAGAWNAQVSLLTGMAAADLMLRSGTGILRTLPSAPDGSVARLRRVAHALGVDWPDGTPYSAVVRALDPRRTRDAAFAQECTTLLRGAGYTVFRDGHVPDHAVHAAVAAPYTHVTAPLRRLVDRYAGELCVAAAAGTPPPGWALGALDALPAEMAGGFRRAAQAERASLDLVEAALLRDRVGEVFDAVVIDVRDARPTAGTVHLDAPAVVAPVESPPGAPPLPLGHHLRVRLTEADPARPGVLFAPA
ncbi:RNB domain-containing ribonuclease [Streptomyces cocklensis]|uniref:Exoribonuclease R n=1 Tax=Actinacidiphila cocklensis TaxID=887465 RepID=A0A9W4DSE6_9ACTN|nr:RNB domain-containing ribonuclease [Actinacidiphila cocklensis]MDD1062388.1 RNB domain-containing ribonuclease [Actinacidiphila cocklensis]CAG6392676.1 Exoribonuclease R [Actinacidiphila cocklensis]